jgi:hypothetical protein
MIGTREDGRWCDEVMITDVMLQFDTLLAESSPCSNAMLYIFVPPI